MHISFSTGQPTELESEPLRLYVVADLGSTRPADLSLKSAEDFGGQLAARAPELFFEVPNLLSRSSPRLEVRLQLRELRDFTPAGLCEQVPLLGRASALLADLGKRDAAAGGALPVRTLKERYADLDRLHQALDLADRQSTGEPGQARQAQSVVEATEKPVGASTPSAADGADSVDRILGMVAAPETQQKASAAVDAFVGHLSRGRRAGPRDAAGTTGAATLVAKQIGQQLDHILHHPDFRRLEAVWRGLRFLVDRCDFRSNVQLEVCHASPAELLDVLERELIEACAAGERPAPDLIVVAGDLLEAPDRRMEDIQRLGALAEQVHSPAIFGVVSGFFTAAAAGATPMASLLSTIEQPGYTKWNALRRKQCARWLVAATNRFLLRSPYEPETSRGLRYRECVLQDEEHLWGDAVWAVAARVAASFKTTGWPTLVLGRQGRIEGLPIRELDVSSGRAMRLPLEMMLGEQAIADLARCGFVALGCRRNSDVAQLQRAPVLYREQGEYDARNSAVGLPYQLFVSRVVHAISRFRESELASNATSPDALREALERYLYGLIASTGPGAYVEVELKEADQAAANSVHLALRAGQFMLGGARVELDFRL
jgi:type VI secretion system protein ImpC